ncbi:hypothetical protein FGK63_06260 [Ruegeria sediminis]|uniref:Lipoprotein n=1 Tax=Ruegeria sediminis TaxID=2583820 RepID=A0ABY2X0G3_9RHOB|nr:hypothetical protein [Ruegeria sediminis]TMV08721.1 hypothetical protein FGK63_06260 [Ruegeria sediminis]
MRKPLIALLVASVSLTACSSWQNSRANPTNWFGDSTSTTVEASATAQETNPLVPQSSGKGLFARPDEVDRSVPIAVVSELRIDPTNTGAIIFASGVAARQGAFGAELRPDPSEENAKNGVLAYTFRVIYPEEPTTQGPERSRTVSDAVNVTTQELEGIRLIRVSGQQNAREARRR